MGVNYSISNDPCLLIYELSQRLVIRQSVEALEEAIFLHGLGSSMESLEEIYTSALVVRVFQVGERQYSLYWKFSHCQLSSLIATIMHFNSMCAMKGTILEYK
jgi:hypothetical protein